MPRTPSSKRSVRKSVFFSVLLSLSLSAGTVWGLDAPSSLSASDGDYARKIGLTWDAVPHATHYRVFRSLVDDASAAVPVGTTAAGFFFDAEPEWTEQVAQFYYWVRAENAQETGPLSASDFGFTVTPTPNRESREPLPPPLAPPENPITAAKAFLGKALFWDEQLSATDTVACGTCHRPEAGGSDPRIETGVTTHPGLDGILGSLDDVTGSPGVPLVGADGNYQWHPVFGLAPQVGRRMPRTVINASYATDVLWDGRATSEFVDPQHGGVVIPSGGALESQVSLPLFDTAEMGRVGLTWQQLIDELEQVRPLALSQHRTSSLDRFIGGRSYPELFEEAFGSPGIDAERIAMAIATYERTLFSDRTPLDRYRQGVDDLDFVVDRGLVVFERARCDVCHEVETGSSVPPSMLFDDDAHFIGVRPQAEDLGRFEVTGVEDDRAKFRTPTLRNVGLRPAFFHQGGIDQMPEVVNFYTRGGDFEAPNLSPDIEANNLPQIDRHALSLFLSSGLNDPRVTAAEPPFDRPVLFSEVGCAPDTTYDGLADTTGLVPKIDAIEPSILGNSSFTITLQDVSVGAMATLVVDHFAPSSSGGIPTTASVFHQEAAVLEGGVGEGYLSLSFELPSEPSLEGSTIYARWYVEDPAPGGSVTSSDLLAISLFSAYPRDGDGDGRIDACSGVVPWLLWSDFESGDLASWSETVAE